MGAPACTARARCSWTGLLDEPVPGGVLDQDRDEVPHPPCVQRPMLFLHHVLDAVPGYVGKLRMEPVNDSIKCPQFFTDSHRHMLGHPSRPVKS